MDSKTKAFIDNTELQISALRKALDGLAGALSDMKNKESEAQPRRRQNLRQVRIADAQHHFNKYAGRVKE